MAEIKTTQRWEEIKSQYTNCLCFSNEKGLYTKRISENESLAELLYRPQGYVGFVSDKLSIPGQNVEITIQSNFGYGNASYLRATVAVGNRYVLDFDISKLYILNKCSVTTLDVSLYDWDGLFKKIIDAYNLISIDNLTTSSIAYVEELSDMLDKDKILVKGYIDNEDNTCWEGQFLITSHVGRKIHDLLKGFEVAKVSDSILLKHTMNLCRKYISVFRSLALDYEDSRVEHLSQALLSIHKFMYENNAGIEYLSLLLDKEV